MRCASVTGRAGRCHAELRVLAGYWRRVMAIGCCRPGIAGIVIGPAPRLARVGPASWPGWAGAFAVAWGRPALAYAARRDASSTLRPMARVVARSGRTSATRVRAAVSAVVCRLGLAMKPTPAAIGATMTARSYPQAVVSAADPPAVQQKTPGQRLRQGRPDASCCSAVAGIWRATVSDARIRAVAVPLSLADRDTERILFSYPAAGGERAGWHVEPA